MCKLRVSGSLVALVAFLLLLGCGGADKKDSEDAADDSTGGVVGAAGASSAPGRARRCGDAGLGLVVNGEESCGFPAVVRLVRPLSDGGNSFCTGTFVSDRAVVTAAHCVDSSATGGVYLSLSETVDPSQSVELGVAGVSAYVNGRTADSDTRADVTKADLAVVIFPPDSAPAVMEIGETRPADGSAVELVGYGLDYWAESPSETGPAQSLAKRTGKSVSQGDLAGRSAKEIADSGVLWIVTGGFTEDESLASAATAGRAMTAFGDSGGPLVQNGLIRGALSSTVKNSQSGRIYSLYVDLLCPAARETLDRANEAGAGVKIPPPTAKADEGGS